MKETVHSVTLTYGNALFHLYQIQLDPIAPPEEQHAVFHEHQFYELHLAHSGSFVYTVGENSIFLQPHQLLIIPPDIPHISIPTPPPQDYRYSVLSLSLTKTDGEDGFYSYFQHTLAECSLHALSMPSGLERRCTELARAERYGALRGECYLKMQASALIYELFESLNEFHFTGFAPRSVCDEQNRIVLLDILVSQHNYSLSDIAAAINYSPRHTARLIQKTYGLSLSQLRKKQMTANGKEI